MKVGVVILNYKVKELVLKCLESVRKSDYKDIFIVVVDNYSQDGLGEVLRSQPGLEFIQNSQNSGYTGGNNLGIRKALDLGAQLVFILNPDTQLESKTISYLVEGINSEMVGIVCPKIYLEDRKTIWYAGGVFDKDNVLGFHRGVDQKDSPEFDQETETEFATGAAIMVKREVFDAVGLFDERYFLYYEDSDFCLRAKRKGYKIMYIPRANVYHSNASSTGLGSPIQDYFITRNRMLFASKFLSLRTRFALLREAFRNLNNHTRRLAFWDFLSGNFGKGSFNV